MRSPDPEASATWTHNRDQNPSPTQDPSPDGSRRRQTPSVGKRTELARYTVAEGERILYGQRIDGIVRFLPGNLVVLVDSLARTEDSTRRPRTTIQAEGCTKAVRRKRPNGASEARRLVPRQRENWS